MRKAVMQVNYPYGAAWRNTVLTVMQTESENATFAFQGEAPLMQYNFVLQVGRGVDVVSICVSVSHTHELHCVCCGLPLSGQERVQRQQRELALL